MIGKIGSTQVVDQINKGQAFKPGDDRKMRDMSPNLVIEGDEGQAYKPDDVFC